MSITLLISLLSIFIQTLHPVHVSMANIEYDAAEDEFELVIKLFTNDFEGILYQKYNANVKMNEAITSEKSVRYITRYINERFLIKFNNEQQANLVFSHKETSHEAVWLHFSFRYDTEFNSVEIYNSLMNDYFRDQQNLLFFSYKSVHQNFMLNSSHERVVIKVN